MKTLDLLATSLGRRDEVPNVELAKEIVKKKDKKAVAELITIVQNEKKDLQHDAIKTLYEIAERDAGLVSSHCRFFITLLESKSNRMQWGAMTALERVTPGNEKIVYAALPKIIAIADAGSVITRDHAVNILIMLCKVKAYQKNAFSLLLEQVLSSPPNQVPAYAEHALPVINEKNKKEFARVLTSRLKDIEKESKKKRVENVLKKISSSPKG
ncbi:MAG TPA: hypothetical protein VI112_17985 [Bacteroidia bacterium]|jgi:hypothetical protein